MGSNGGDFLIYRDDFWSPRRGGRMELVAVVHGSRLAIFIKQGKVLPSFF